MPESAVTAPGRHDARTRWRGAADRLWSIALVDDEAYRDVVVGVGAVLAVLRRDVATQAALLAVDTDPGDVLAAAGVATGPTSGAVVAAACAVRADEIDAAMAREERAARVATARAAGRAWVALEEGGARSVSMHVATGLALVVTDDPYRGREPHGLGELALDTATGEPCADRGEAETWFAVRAERDTALARRRAEIAGLDDGGSMVSDER